MGHRRSQSKVADPFANVKGDSKKFRVIHGTASPDGRYAIGLGLARKEINWDDFVNKDDPENGPTYYAENEEDVRNYVVDLAQQTILGETGLAWDGTRRRYNHPECIVKWSPDSAVFVQLLNSKWTSYGCVSGKIGSGPKFLGTVDLIKALSQKAYAFAKQPFDAKKGGFLTFSINKIGNDGVIDLEAAEYCAAGDCKGDTKFAVGERLRLRETPKGLRVDILKARRLASESSEE